ncbi:uncharacterized protein LOC127801707 isoform X2 [Diospyros lotus]|uniref:uncharacterized protein LOC127801707 isoform X2 n=1 Tax=Diospyros lotus TaxID=55363 RepID=UPI0022563451|nr:uncharacterized protein LOC127801707 isoform X2 [Diospyros lotus]
MTKLIDQKGKGCARLRKNLFIYAIHQGIFGAILTVRCFAQVKYEISRSYEKIVVRLKLILKEVVSSIMHYSPSLPPS